MLVKRAIRGIERKTYYTSGDYLDTLEVQQLMVVIV